MDVASVLSVEEGDVFVFEPEDKTQWVVTLAFVNPSGTVILQANGPFPGVRAVFELPPAAWLYLV